MSDSTSDDSAAMAAPTEAHKKLEPFIGTFKATVKIWMGPGDPVESTGTMVNTFDLGGLFLKHTYTGDLNEGPFPAFEGRGYWGYNTVTGLYEGFWVDNASTLMQTETGSIDDSGKAWTMKGTMANPQTGDDMVKRSVVTLQDNDHHLMEMFFDTGDGEMKAMEISYTRA